MSSERILPFHLGLLRSAQPLATSSSLTSRVDKNAHRLDIRARCGTSLAFWNGGPSFAALGISGNFWMKSPFFELLRPWSS